jgi:hypothetical protein
MSKVGEFFGSTAAIPTVETHYDDELDLVSVVIVDSSGPFEYCAQLTPDEASALMSSLGLAIARGRQFQHEKAQELEALKAVA